MRNGPCQSVVDVHAFVAGQRTISTWPWPAPGTLPLHVRDLPVFDYREALRPSTRLGPPEEEEFEEEG